MDAPTARKFDHELLKVTHEGNVKDAITKLTANEADQNFQDPETGNTALHIAVSIKNRVLVRLMIIFDADLTLKNRQHKTALELAQEKGFSDIADDISTILNLESDLNTDEHKVLDPAERHPHEAFLLSLDGGGVKGLVFLQVLLEMEKRRIKRYPDSKESLLSHFNWMTGNSAGGISALALAGPDDSTKYVRQLFFELKDSILDGDLPIPNEGHKGVDEIFKRAYEDIYRPSAMMSDIKNRNVSVMTTLCRQSPASLHIMSNYGGLRELGTDPPEEQLIWKAARATSSVPVFFHPQDHVYVDGGLIANNPTTDTIIDMYDHAKKEDKKLELKFVLSLGTGIACEPKQIDDVDFEPSRMGKCVAKIADFFHAHKIGKDIDGALTVTHNSKAFTDLLEIVSAQIVQPNGQVLRRAEFVCEQVGAKYHRINPAIPKTSFLTTDNAKIIDMIYNVMKYMLENCRQQIDPVLDYIYGRE
jgi:calcium-independent phospholipase A2